MGNRKEDYKKHYPNGYELVYILVSEVTTHTGLMKTYKLNQKLVNNKI